MSELREAISHALRALTKRNLSPHYRAGIQKYLAHLLHWYNQR